ncbi:hypothetical protein FSP39_010334 [Pinctada imbricata]|uniref:BZIP domain-containing protein n=1 Tax=Pinctada imbricata TaxID=66713 RepID=A0AA88Y334_PINIB|nr:hypothetical protein FSP39_010334 [Pinctada imbricata]
MVRVLCQSPVSGSCSVSGVQGNQVSIVEGVIDRKAAMDAVQAMQGGDDSNFSADFNFSNFSGSNSESGSSTYSSDSDEQSKLTIDEDKCLDNYDPQEKVEKRRARRRERNKICAQAYRQRRRQQDASQKESLEDLLKRNKELLKQVKDLEEQKSIIEGLILKKAKIPWHWPYHPTPYHPTTSTVLVAMPTCATMEAVAMGAPMSMAANVPVAS